MNRNSTRVLERQEPLRKLYRQSPADAALTDCARAMSNGSDAFHGTVFAGDDGEPRDFGIHRVIGGDHDLPNPGDILCAALAACLDSTLRMLAERLGVGLESLEVSVRAHADARGCLMVDPAVQAGFQRLEVEVAIQTADSAQPAQVAALTNTAEKCCVVLQTLRNGVPVETAFGDPRDSAGEARAARGALTG